MFRLMCGCEERRWLRSKQRSKWNLSRPSNRLTIDAYNFAHPITAREYLYQERSMQTGWLWTGIKDWESQWCRRRWFSVHVDGIVVWRSRWFDKGEVVVVMYFDWNDSDICLQRQWLLLLIFLQRLEWCLLSRCNNVRDLPLNDGQQYTVKTSTLQWNIHFIDITIKYLGLLSCTIFFDQCIHLFLRWIFCFPFRVFVSRETIISWITIPSTRSTYPTTFFEVLCCSTETTE